MSTKRMVSGLEKAYQGLSSLKIGTRIAGGFAAILAISLLIAIIGIMGLRDSSRRMNLYAGEAESSVRLGDITTEIGLMRRNMLQYSTRGDDAALAEVKKARNHLAEMLEQGQLQEMAKELAQYSTIIDRVETLRRERDVLVQGTLATTGKQVRDNLEAVVRGSMAADGFEAGANASVTLATFYRAQLAASDFLTDPTPAGAKEARKLIEDFVSEADGLMMFLRDPAMRRKANDSVNLAMDYGGAFEKVAASALETNELIFTTLPRLGDQFTALATQMKAAQDRTMTTIAEETVSGIAASTRLGIVFAIAALALGGGLSFLIARSIVGPVHDMTQAMTRLAGGDLDVTVPATLRQDEIGNMGRAVQVFKDNAQAVAKLRAEQAEIERRGAEDRKLAMNGLANDFQSHVSAVVEHIASAATEMEATSRSMASISDRTSDQATAAAAAAEQASANVQTVASAAEELTSSISEISRQVTHASATAAAAARKAEQTDTIVRGMAEAAQRIDEVVGIITAIAGQTNLLALNATIEAARAGEAGKGFAVVAGEVKNLANQTSRATGEIAGQISAIQSVTREAVAAIRDIGATVNEINEISTAVAAAVEEQQAATREIARNVEQAATGTAEVARNVAGVNEAAIEAGRAANQVLHESQSLSTASEELGAESSNFIERVRRA